MKQLSTSTFSFSSSCDFSGDRRERVKYTCEMATPFPEFSAQMEFGPFCRITTGLQTKGYKTNPTIIDIQRSQNHNNSREHLRYKKVLLRDRKRHTTSGG